MNASRRSASSAFRSILLMGAGATGPAAWSQPCSIDLGPDVTISAGTAQLNAPAGFSSYLWSTTATTPNITVGTPGIYTCQVSYPTGNLVTNGNFSSGNTGFLTQFTYNNNLVVDGNYWIGTNAASYHPQFIGTGNGQFMIVNAGWQQPGWRPWCETVPVCPGQTYTLSYRGVSLASQNPPLLTLFVNNEWTYQERQFGPLQNQWQTFTHTWTAPAGVTSAEFCIQVSSGWGVGNDFGIDDITISSTVVLSDQVTVLADPLPVELVSFTGEAIQGHSHLHWQTASERNNDHFLVLRSADLVTWEEIARIPGAGNSQALKDYQAVDIAPLTGVNYYHLVLVDVDGNATVSDVVAVDHTGKNTFLIGPNPCPVGMPFQFQGTFDEVRVTDHLGRSIPCIVSRNTLSIQAGAGIYVLTTRHGAESRTVRLMVQ
ncbi:MAG TPA: hypothetical protein PLB89_14780 [Flavobacteriales bacterium]|nr:hypothetical protein [Flavobacteriales bacterium]